MKPYLFLIKWYFIFFYLAYIIRRTGFPKGNCKGMLIQLKQMLKSDIAYYKRQMVGSIRR